MKKMQKKEQKGRSEPVKELREQQLECVKVVACAGMGTCYMCVEC